MANEPTQLKGTMKLTINKKLAVDALRELNVAVAGRSAMPVLDCVRIEAKGEVAILTTTNLDITLSLSFPCTVDEAGAICVNAKKLAQSIGMAPDDSIQLKINGSKLDVKSGTSRFSFQTIPADDFPNVADPVDATVQEMTAAEFAALSDGIGSVLTAASKDQNRYVLNGVHVASDGMAMKVVATDGRRVSIVSVPQDDGMAIDPIIIPIASAKIVAEMESDDGAKVIFSNRMIAIHSGPRSFYSKLVEGVYPNWKQVVPKDSGLRFTVESDGFTRMLSRAVVACAVDGLSVKLTFAGKSIDCESTSPDVSFNESIVCEGDTVDEPIVVAVNPVFLKDAVASCGVTLAVCVKDGLSPLVIESGLFTAVVMPLRVN